MPDPTPDKSGFLESGSRRIYWEYFGRGEREAVCLLNGLAMHTRAWYSFLPLLPDHDVLLFDYPGQGQSSSEDVPCLIPEFCDYLTAVADLAGLDRFHLMGISYGGFVGLEYARLFPHRLHTLTISGILLSHEELFGMYQALSLLFYTKSDEVFEVYTHYMYEKIFGEAFVRKAGRDTLEVMRGRFYERYKGQRHALVRLTEAQDPFFASLDANLPAYRAIRTPTLIMAGEHDRAIPPWVQRKITTVLPCTRFEVVPECGHVVYLERPDVFFGNLRKFMQAKTLAFE